MNGRGRTAGNDWDIAGKQKGAQDDMDDGTTDDETITPAQIGMADTLTPTETVDDPTVPPAAGPDVVVIATVTGPEVVTVIIGAGGAPLSPGAVNPPAVVNSPSTLILRGGTFAYSRGC
jgi:hypothetical protein